MTRSANGTQQLLGMTSANYQSNPPAPAPAGDPPPAPAPPAPAGDPPPAPADPPAGDPPSGENDVDKLREALAKARRDEEARAKELREANKAKAAAEAELQKRTDAEKTELQLATERAAALEKELADERLTARTAAIRYAVVHAATAENFTAPEDAFHFLDLGAVEFDDKGQPQGISDLVKQLAKDKEYLLKPKNANPPPPSDKSNRDGKGMTPEELRQRQEEAKSYTRSTF